MARDALEFDPARLEKIEERLFALRAMARKHNVAVAGLAALTEKFSAQLAALDDGEAGLKKLAAAAKAARAAYVDGRRSAGRRAAQGRGQARQGGGRRTRAAQAGAGEVRHRSRRTAGSGMVGSRHRSRAVHRRRPIPARRRRRSPRSPPAASCRASCWRSRSASPRWATRRPSCSTRSIPASAAPPRPPWASG